MKINIPQVNTEIVLTEDWNFKLLEEHRNASLWDALRFKGSRGNSYYSRWGIGDVAEVTLPMGTILSIDRYVISGHETDTVTFKIRECPLPVFQNSKKCKARFRVRLSELAGLECELRKSAPFIP